MPHPITPYLPLTAMLFIAWCATLGSRPPRYASWAWSAAFAVSVAAAYRAGTLDLTAAFGVALMALCAWTARLRPPPRTDALAAPSAQRVAWRARRQSFALLITAVLAMMFMRHAWPGFVPYGLLEPQRLTPDAVPFGLNARFDTAVAASMLFAWVVRRADTRAAWRAAFRLRFWAIAALTLGLLVVLAWLSGRVAWAPKWPPIVYGFVWWQCIGTCLAEECWFRGVLQERLAQAAEARGRPRWIALIIASLLFGAAHAPGGIGYVVLATVAGIGYGLAYEVDRRIESALALHLLVNATHFVLFTYPALA